MQILYQSLSTSLHLTHSVGAAPTSDVLTGRCFGWNTWSEDCDYDVSTARAENRTPIV